MQNILERNYLKLYPKDSANHILFVFYSKANLFEKRKEILDQMKQKKLKKIPEISKITINDVVHVFHANEKDHPEIDEINRYKEDLRQRFIKWYQELYNTEFVVIVML